jgi:hypothetical protein
MRPAGDRRKPGSAGDYFNVGTRVGQRLGPFAFEQGITANMEETEVGLGVHAGIGLVSPALILRGSWSPVKISGMPARTRLEFIPDRWWQASLLYGSQRRPEGYGWAVGARTSKFGIGPVLESRGVGVSCGSVGR